ncbi:type II toxin-antitoxin system RelE/ParE family toxin [bacterium]|nr:type II toxin-antitoxin system RelE/ParE family toxin [bacterium]
MRSRVKTLPKADADIRRMASYIHEHSPQGAEAWLTALEQSVSWLENNATAAGEAWENKHFELEIKQKLFKTRRGLVYRLVYTIMEGDVLILRVRGPGQAPIDPADTDRPLDS